jgi:phosphatidylglycerophosphate synthase
VVDARLAAMSDAPASEAPSVAERSRRPSLAELRSVSQPALLLGDVSRESWMGRLYMRRISLRLTRLLVRTRVSPDTLTWGMVLSGLAAAIVLTVPSPWAIAASVLLVQLQVLFDCSDGELARWRREAGTWPGNGARGIYLDRFGHYTTDAGLVAAVGVHADGGLGSIAGWTTLGLAAAVLVLVSRAETDLVHVARAYVGLPRFEPAAVTPRVGGVRRLRRVVHAMPINRLLLAWDLSLVLVVVAVVDVASGSTIGMQVLTVVTLVTGMLVVAGHLLTILTSARLR